MSTPDDLRIGILGAGNMGEALLRGVLAAGLVPPERAAIADLRGERVAALTGELGVRAAPDNAALVAGSDVVLLCVKPQVMFEVLRPIADRFGQRHTVISVAAGITLSAFEAALPDGVPMIRVMPNTPCLVGAGVSALARGRHASDAHVATARAIVAAVGVALEVPEADLDGVTALSGSGPAYVFHLIEAMARGGEAVGLAPDVARTLALETVAGAAALARATGVPAGELRQRVMSPGGTTEAAIRSLDAAGFQDDVIRAMRAARDRSVEMAAAFAE